MENSSGSFEGNALDILAASASSDMHLFLNSTGANGMVGNYPSESFPTTNHQQSIETTNDNTSELYYYYNINMKDEGLPLQTFLKEDIERAWQLLPYQMIAVYSWYIELSDGFRALQSYSGEEFSLMIDAYHLVLTHYKNKSQTETMSGSEQACPPSGIAPIKPGNNYFLDLILTQCAPIYGTEFLRRFSTEIECKPDTATITSYKIYVNRVLFANSIEEVIVRPQKDWVKKKLDKSQACPFYCWKKEKKGNQQRKMQQMQVLQQAAVGAGGEHSQGQRQGGQGGQGQHLAVGLGVAANNSSNVLTTTSVSKQPMSRQSSAQPSVSSTNNNNHHNNHNNKSYNNAKQVHSNNNNNNIHTHHNSHTNNNNTLGNNGHIKLGNTNSSQLYQQRSHPTVPQSQQLQSAQPAAYHQQYIPPPQPSTTTTAATFPSSSPSPETSKRGRKRKVVESTD